MSPSTPSLRYPLPCTHPCDSIYLSLYPPFFVLPFPIDTLSSPPHLPSSPSPNLFFPPFPVHILTAISSILSHSLSLRLSEPLTSQYTPSPLPVKTKATDKEKDKDKDKDKKKLIDRYPGDVDALLALCADRLLIERASAQRQGTNSTYSGSAHLLFKLLKILVDKHGAVHSLDGCTASSPEGLIVSLLLDGPSAQPLSLSPNQGLEQEQLLERVQLYSAFESATATAHHNGSSGGSGSSSSGSSSTSASPPHSSSILALHTLKDKDSTKGELYAHLEGLLLRGKREEAVAAAVGHREWPIALLIASNCGPEEYREVTKAYATCTFPNASPLHLAALLFSNQVGLQCPIPLPHILSHFI